MVIISPQISNCFPEKVSIKSATKYPHVDAKPLYGDALLRPLETHFWAYFNRLSSCAERIIICIARQMSLASTVTNIFNAFITLISLIFHSFISSVVCAFVPMKSSWLQRFWVLYGLFSEELWVFMAYIYAFLALNTLINKRIKSFVFESSRLVCG